MPRKSTLTNKEIKEALSKPFEIWPACDCSYCEMRDFKRGPTPDQKKAYVIPHKHDYDIVLCYGGSRGAKSQAAIAKGIEYALKYPGSTLLVGAETLELLKKTAMKYWQERFTIRKPWDHPLVSRAPGDHNKCLQLENGSQVWFLYFAEFEQLRGIGVSFVHIEEGSLLESSDAMEELVRRMSETLAPQNQMMITTNPEESHGWIHEKFALEQFEPGYKGEPIPIGKPCNCQYCQTCIAEFDEQGEPIKIEWVEGKDLKGRDALVCPRCPTQLMDDGDGNMIPRQTFKANKCPGNEQYMRVIFFDSVRNPHVKPSYRETNKTVSGEHKFNLYGAGQVVELRQGKAYFHFSRDNVYERQRSLDYDKEMYWSFDFNVPRQCSVICQDRIVPEGVEVDVIDEVVIGNAGPVEIAKEFLFRYPTYDQWIHMYGDPSALNNKTAYNEASQFQIIYDIITDPLNHLTPEELAKIPNVVPKKVKTMPQKIKGQTKIPVILKVDSLNYKLCDATQRRWIFINPSCKWLIKSLTNIKWKETAGRQGLDTNPDRADMKNPNKSYEAVRTVTHISDALGYLVAKRWPVVVEENNAVIVIPGEATLEFNDKGTISHEIAMTPEEKELMEQNLKSKLSTIKPEPNSLLEIFHEVGVFDDDNIIDFYY